jgi:hypothetical protein
LSCGIAGRSAWWVPQDRWRFTPTGAGEGESGGQRTINLCHLLIAKIVAVVLQIVFQHRVEVPAKHFALLRKRIARWKVNVGALLLFGDGRCQRSDNDRVGVLIALVCGNDENGRTLSSGAQ